MNDTPTHETDDPTTKDDRRPRWLVPVDIIRGFFIGLAELVPGVSGGTIALIVGVYDQLIDSASHVISAAKVLVTGPDRAAGAKAHLRKTDWWLVVPVLIGMATAVLTVAGLMEMFVTEHGELARGLFFGLVATSIAVPLSMVPAKKPGTSGWTGYVLFVVAAIAAWILTSFAGGHEVTDPNYIFVFLAAAVAICALVVPGVSGSFFLLAVGLYSTTLGAVHDRDLTYIAVFALGAIVGLASFVQVLKILLTKYRRGTLMAMAGLMLGSLRALWPWQAATGGGGEGVMSLVAPYQPILGPVVMAILGSAIVLVLLKVEKSTGVLPADTEEAERVD